MRSAIIAIQHAAAGMLLPSFSMLLCVPYVNWWIMHVRLLRDTAARFVCKMKHNTRYILRFTRPLLPQPSLLLLLCHHKWICLRRATRYTRSGGITMLVRCKYCTAEPATWHAFGAPTKCHIAYKAMCISNMCILYIWRWPIVWHRLDVQFMIDDPPVKIYAERCLSLSKTKHSQKSYVLCVF